MIEHPVPQNITEYRFHLIGNMTVKQFLILLAGSGLAFLVYTTNLPSLLKWPLILALFGFGAAAAFVPYEERTLDQWLVNFLRAIYRPTKYYWRRQPKMPSFFTYVSRRNSTDDQLQQTDSWLPNRQQQIQTYLSSLQSVQDTTPDPLDVLGHNQHINDLFNQVAAASNVSPGENQQELLKPHLQVRARPLRPMAKSNPKDVSNQSSRVHSSDTSRHLPPPTAPNKASEKSLHSTTSPAADQNIQRGTVKVAPMSTGNHTPRDKKVDNHDFPHQNSPSQKDSYLSSDNNISAPQPSAVQPVIFNRDLPFPSLPEEPNMLVGMVHDSHDKIVPGAIIEILDESGNTARAMKTNALGQFYISSPLQNGVYHIETEGTDLQFPVYEIKLDGQVLDPIDIKAWSVDNSNSAAKAVNNPQSLPTDQQADDNQKTINSAPALHTTHNSTATAV